MKILVVIVNYGKSQLKYLEKIINEYKSMKYEVDIVIHSNIPLKYNGVEVIIEKLDDYEKLPFTTRRTIYKRKDDYDLYIYSENDHLITQKNIESFLAVTKILPKKYIAGFMQYELYDDILFYPGINKKFKWIENSILKINNYIFAHFTNVHQASFLLTKEQLQKVIKNFVFLNESLNYRYSLKYRLIESFYYRILNFYEKNFMKYINYNKNSLYDWFLNYIIKNFNLLNEIWNSNYSAKCRAGTDVYIHGGFKKVIPISHFDDFLIHHMPNSYKNSLGIFDDLIRKIIYDLRLKIEPKN